MLGAGRPHIVEGPTLVDLPTGDTNDQSNATLTDDMLEMFFSSNKKIWTVRRPSADMPFGTPIAVDALNSGGAGSSPAISPDGLTLWFASDRNTTPMLNRDIWESRRASTTAEWSAPVVCADLNSAADDLPRPPGNHAIVMPMSSTRSMPLGKAYEIFFAGRLNTNDDFGLPAQAPEIPHPPEDSSTDPFLTADGFTLFYSKVVADDMGDIVVATHAAWGEPFSGFQTLDDINTRWKESDPWLSSDGRTMYFTSNRAELVLDGGASPDSATDAGTVAAHPDRIYRVVFDTPWAP